MYIPNLSRPHAIEQRVLTLLHLEMGAIIPTSKLFQAQLKRQISPYDVSTTSNHSFRRLIDEDGVGNTSNESSRCHTYSTTRNRVTASAVRPGSSSSCDSNLVVTVAVDIIESPLEWSSRMKRYHEEEIKYLGLEIIRYRAPAPRHPNLILETPLENLSCSISPRASHHKKLDSSRHRFEQWLDTLSPRTTASRRASQFSHKYLRV